MPRIPGIVIIAGVILAVAAPAVADPPPTGANATAEAAGLPAAGDRPEQATSEAEQIAQLQRAIATDQDQLAQLEAALNDPRREYARAEADFERLDAQLRQKQKAAQALRGENKADRAKQLESEIAALQPSWKLAKDRFDLAIEERKTRQSEIALLRRKVERDRRALAALTDPSAPGAPSTDPSRPATAAERPAEQVPPDAPTTAQPGSPAPVAAAPATSARSAAPAPARGSATPGAMAVEGGTAPADGAGPSKPLSRELLKAFQDEKAEAVAVKDAEQKEQSIAARLADLEADIALEKRLLVMAQKKADNAHEASSAAAEQLRQKSVSGGTPEELQALARKARGAEERAGVARDEVRQHSGRLDELQSERAGLLAQQVAARDRARAEERRLAELQGRIRQLENPFAPRNVLRWLVDHGPKMLAIALAMVVLTWLAHVSSHRIVALVSRGGFRGSKEEREARAHTLVGVFHNASTVLILSGGILMLLQEAGIPIAPLLGGAAVFGLAVAFGAQNLIRDYFYGFVILLENQYKINDAVRIGGLSGTVERITLRMTVLRDLEGCVHFLPNGQISAVTNMTHGWSRAVFDLHVAYKEDIDRVMALVVELGKELRADPAFGPLILDDMTMLGVDALAESAVVVKFFVKTRASQSGTVKREMLRRIKNRFDKLGIEIPLPQRVLYHRLENGDDEPTAPPRRIGRPSPRPADDPRKHL